MPESIKDLLRSAIDGEPCLLLLFMNGGKNVMSNNIRIRREVVILWFDIFNMWLVLELMECLDL